jgi:hypothetical protein
MKNTTLTILLTVPVPPLLDNGLRLTVFSNEPTRGHHMSATSLSSRYLLEHWTLSPTCYYVPYSQAPRVTPSRAVLHTLLSTKLPATLVGVKSAAALRTMECAPMFKRRKHCTIKAHTDPARRGPRILYGITLRFKYRSFERIAPQIGVLADSAVSIAFET